MCLALARTNYAQNIKIQSREIFINRTATQLWRRKKEYRRFPMIILDINVGKIINWKKSSKNHPQRQSLEATT